MTGPRRSGRLLLVEDDPLNADVIGRVLAVRGYRISRVRTAEEAIRAAAEGSFDLVLLDNVLPGMTGMQAIGELTRLTRAPIFVMTGHADDELEKDALLLGARGFMRKPLDFDALDERLQALLLP